MLDEYDQTIVGGNKRITLPMGDALTLRHCLDPIRAWCHEIDRLTRLVGTPDYTERRVMLMVAAEINCLNRKLKETALQNGIEIVEGRRKGSKTAERVDNEDGTVIVTAFGRTQNLDKLRR